MSGKQRLTREHWIKAAFQALLLDGPKAIRVDRLCSSLGVTKGSFYWHFEDLAALKNAMVSHWRLVARGDLIASATTDELTPRDLVIRLFEAAASRQPGDHSAAGASIALRHWAGADKSIQRELADADGERLAFLTTQVRAAGLTGAEARSRASFLYAALIGLEQLAGEPALTPVNIPGFIDAVFTNQAKPEA
jgi:AcrR family transcriptional regulator